MIEVSVLIVSGSKEGSGVSAHNAQTHQSLCCSHIQSMDVDEDSKPSQISNPAGKVFKRLPYPNLVCFKTSYSYI